MVVVLSGISLVMAAALGFVYNTTKGPIELANQKKVVDAIAKVVPEGFDNDPVKERYAVFADGDSVYFYPAKKGTELLGTAVETFTEKGFSGHIALMVGFLPDGTIYKSEVLDQKETPGLGTLMLEPKFKGQFEGKDPKSFKLVVKKDGGDVDAITAATISSRAYCDAIQRAIDCMAGANGETAALTSSDPSGKVLKLETPALLKKVLPAFDNDPMTEVVTVDGLEMFVARSGGKLCGIAVKSYAEGYHETEPVWLLTGFLPDGTIKNLCCLQHKESKGKGESVLEDEFLRKLCGKNPATYKLNPKSEGGDVEAISGCTVTTTALCEALQAAYNAFKKGGVK